MSESKSREVAKTEKSLLNDIGALLCRPVIFHYAIIWLIILLFVGTIAQRTIGLHIAQERFFSSWFIWFGVVPVPGGRLTMVVIFINLLCKTIFKSNWHYTQIGVLISHGGALLLLAGGFVTALTAVEGNMAIVEGETSSFFISYHDVELAIINTSNDEHEDVTAFSGPFLNEGAEITDEAFPATFRVKTYYKNADVTRRADVLDDPYKAAARRFELKEKPLETENEMNQGGMLLEVEGLSDEVDGTYLIVENMSVQQTLDMNGTPYRVELRRRRYQLPFAIEVLEFEKQVHPGTTMARSYSSKVNLIENNAKRQIMISMNEPLRNRGYTMYQSSFVEGAADTTILAVVKNHGRMFPYISSIIICIGILIHLGFQLPRLVKRVSV